MSDHLQPWIEPELEARVVALVLGETSDFEREQLEAIIKQRPEVALFKERMEALHGMLSEWAEQAPEDTPDDSEEWRLGDERRTELLETIGVTSETQAALSEGPGQAKEQVVVFANWKRPALLLSKIAAAACVVFSLGWAVLRFAPTGSGGNPMTVAEHRFEAFDTDFDSGVQLYGDVGSGGLESSGGVLLGGQRTDLESRSSSADHWGRAAGLPEQQLVESRRELKELEANLAVPGLSGEGTSFEVTTGNMRGNLQLLSKESYRKSDLEAKDSGATELGFPLYDDTSQNYFSYQAPSQVEKTDDLVVVDLQSIRSPSSSSSLEGVDGIIDEKMAAPQNGPATWQDTSDPMSRGRERNASDSPGHGQVAPIEAVTGPAPVEDGIQERLVKREKPEPKPTAVPAEPQEEFMREGLSSELGRKIDSAADVVDSQGTEYITEEAPTSVDMGYLGVGIDASGNQSGDISVTAGADINITGDGALSVAGTLSENGSRGGDIQLGQALDDRRKAEEKDAYAIVGHGGYQAPAGDSAPDSISVTTEGGIVRFDAESDEIHGGMSASVDIGGGASGGGGFAGEVEKLGGVTAANATAEVPPGAAATGGRRRGMDKDAVTDPASSNGDDVFYGGVSISTDFGDEEDRPEAPAPFGEEMEEAPPEALERAKQKRFAKLSEPLTETPMRKLAEKEAPFPAIVEPEPAPAPAPNGERDKGKLALQKRMNGRSDDRFQTMQESPGEESSMPFSGSVDAGNESTYTFRGGDMSGVKEVPKAEVQDFREGQGQQGGANWNFGVNGTLFKSTPAPEEMAQVEQQMSMLESKLEGEDRDRAEPEKALPDLAKKSRELVTSGKPVDAERKLTRDMESGEQLREVEVVQDLERELEMMLPVVPKAAQGVAAQRQEEVKLKRESLAPEDAPQGISPEIAGVQMNRPQVTPGATNKAQWGTTKSNAKGEGWGEGEIVTDTSEHNGFYDNAVQSEGRVESEWETKDGTRLQPMLEEDYKNGRGEMETASNESSHLYSMDEHGAYLTDENVDSLSGAMIGHGGRFTDLDAIPIDSIELDGERLGEVVDQLADYTVAVDGKETAGKGVKVPVILDGGDAVADKQVSLRMYNTNLGDVVRKISEVTDVDVVTNDYGVFFNPTADEKLKAQKVKFVQPAAQPVPSNLEETLASEEPFSTFSLHVSDVSFKLAQTALAAGEWPDASRIRVEEFVNAFDYGDPMPSQEEKVACALEQAAHPFLQQRNLLRISMRTAAKGRAQSTPLRLTVLLDNSGSMDRPDRQQAVQQAFWLLTQQLQPLDHVTLIGFARTPRLLAQTSGESNKQLTEIVATIPSQGGTNMEQAVLLAWEKAKEQKLDGAQNRIVLLTDGAANLGDADPDRLSALVERMRQDGIAFDAAGVGAEGINDEILEALTRKGDGRYYVLNRAEDADEGFASQIAGALRPAAQNVKIQVEFNPERVGNYKLLGFEKHLLKKEDFRDDSVDAAELAAEEAGVALYQVEPLPEGSGDIGFVSVRFKDMASGEMVERRWPIPYEPSAASLDQAAPSVQIASVAALFAAKLKGDPLGESVQLGTLSQVLAGLPVTWRESARVKELRQMVDQARLMSNP